MNVILNPDRTRKCVISVGYDEWASINPGQAAPATDIFVENAPQIPDGMHTPQLSIDGSTWIEANPTSALTEMKAAAKQRIDIKAGEIRAGYCSQGTFIEEEYHRAMDEALAWQAAGSPPASVSPSVQCWADASGMTPSAAAADIVAEGTRLYDALDNIRAARLAGKAAVSAAADAAAIDAAELSANTALEALRAP